jgi:hypothetical protein
MTNIKVYGVANAVKSPVISKKISDALQAKTKDDWEQIVSFREETNIAKYGVLHPMHLGTTKDKIKKTSLNRYGTENPSSSDEVKQKRLKTFRSNFGVDNPFQNDVIIKKIKDTRTSNYYETIITQFSEVTPLFDTFKGVEEIYDWLCNKCGAQFKDNLDNGKIPRCYLCYPRNSYGIQENEIGQFLESLSVDIIKRDRTLIKPLELDIVVPANKLAIEYCGLYWHSELNGQKNRTYHVNKYNLCLQQNIQLLTIFDDEWLLKQNCVKSILMAKLNLLEKTYARRCSVREIDTEEEKKFLKETHIQGYNASSVAYGLYQDGILQSVMSFGKPRYNQKFDFEILRYATRKGVVGGASKLFSYFVKDRNPNSVISYSDLRWGRGLVYINMGFKFEYTSKPDYWYLTPDKIRYHRTKYMKKALIKEGFDPVLTEWQIMQLKGFDRIWDCGSNVFVWRQL